MDREEFRTLVKGMKAVYTDPKFIADKDAFDVWFQLLKDLDYEKAGMAVQKHMMSSRFPPTIADVREQYACITQPQELNEMEAWSLVSSALRNGIYGAEEEFAKLPETVRKAVGNACNLRFWAESGSEAVETVIQSNFIRTYRVVAARKKEAAGMPEGIRRLIQAADRNHMDAGRKTVACIGEKI